MLPRNALLDLTLTLTSLFDFGDSIHKNIGQRVGTRRNPCWGSYKTDTFVPICLLPDRPGLPAVGALGILGKGSKKEREGGRESGDGNADGGSEGGGGGRGRGRRVQ